MFKHMFIALLSLSIGCQSAFTMKEQDNEKKRTGEELVATNSEKKAKKETYKLTDLHNEALQNIFTFNGKIDLMCTCESIYKALQQIKKCVQCKKIFALDQMRFMPCELLKDDVVQPHFVTCVNCMEKRIKDTRKLNDSLIWTFSCPHQRCNQAFTEQTLNDAVSVYTAIVQDKQIDKQIEKFVLTSKDAQATRKNCLKIALNNESNNTILALLEFTTPEQAFDLAKTLFPKILKCNEKNMETILEKTAAYLLAEMNMRHSLYYIGLDILQTNLEKGFLRTQNAKKLSLIMNFILKIQPNNIKNVDSAAFNQVQKISFILLNGILSRIFVPQKQEIYQVLQNFIENNYQFIQKCFQHNLNNYYVSINEQRGKLPWKIFVFSVENGVPVTLLAQTLKALGLPLDIGKCNTDPEDIRGLPQNFPVTLINKIKNKISSLPAQSPWLHYTVINNNLPYTQWLIEQGANINQKNILGQTALDLAKNKGFTEIQKLLEEGLKSKCSIM